MDFTKSKAFINSCLEGDYIAAFQHLSKVDIPRATDGLGVTALHIACRQGVVEIVQDLLASYNFDPNCRDINGVSPFHEACYSGNLETVRFLVLKALCNTNIVDCLGETGLHVACRQGWMEIVSFLVDGRHCDLNIASIKGNTPLHIAAYWGHCDVVKFLVERCCDIVHCKNANGDSLIHIACDAGWLDVVKTIVKDRPEYLNAINSDGYIPVHLACKSKRIAVVQYLIRTSQPSTELGNALLHCACRSGSVIQYFAYELHENLWHNAQYYPIIPTASVHGHRRASQCHVKSYSILHTASVHGHKDIVSFLVENDYCNPNIPNEYGNTALHVACRTSHIEVVQLLLSFNLTKPNLPNCNGNTPLHVACLSKNLPAVELIISHTSIDANLANLSGNTPLHVACELGWLAGVKAIVASSRCNPDLHNVNGDTPVLVAYEKSKFDIIEYLAYGNHCNFNVVSSRSQAVIHTAFQDRNFRVIRALAACSKCDLDLRDSYGDTILQLACQRGDFELFYFLLSTGRCDSLLLDSAGDTVLHTICRRYKYLQEDGLHRKAFMYLMTGRTPRDNLWFDTGQVALPVPGIVEAKNKSGLTAFQLALTDNATGILKHLVPYTTLSTNCPDEWMGVIKHVRNDRDSPNALAHCRTSLSNVLWFLVHSPLYSPSKADVNGNTLIHYACTQGLLDMVKYAIEELDLDPQQENNLHQRPLNLAYTYGHTKVTWYLLQKLLCNPDPSDVNNSAVFHYAFTHGWLDVAKCAAELCKVSVVKSAGLVALELSLHHCDQDTVTFLVPITSDIGVMSRLSIKDQTPFSLACKSGNLKLITLLLLSPKPGIRPDYTKTISDTGSSVQAAFAEGRTDVVKLLLIAFHRSLKELNHSGSTFVLKACMTPNIEMLTFLASIADCDLDLPNTHGVSPLHLCCERGYQEMVELLLSTGCCNPNARDALGNTPLHIACENGHLSTVKRLLTRKRICHIMVPGPHLFIPSEYADPSIQNSHGETPLDIAFYYKHMAITRVLLHYHEFSRSLPVDNDGNTLLHTICELGWIDCAKSLVTLRMCDPNHQNNVGQTALHVCAYSRNKHLAEFLLHNAQCKPHLEDVYGNTILHIASECAWYDIAHELLTVYGCKPCKNKSWCTPIDIACEKGNTEIVKLFAREGFIPTGNDVDAHSVDPLLHASFFPESLDALDFLVSNLHWNPRQADVDGDTALHVACYSGNLQTVQYLLSLEGKRLATKTNWTGVTPFHRACQENNLAVVEYVLSAKANNPKHSHFTPGSEPDLDVVVTRDEFHLAWLKMKLDLVKLLIPYLHPIPQVSDSDGNNLIHRACIEGWTESVTRLATHQSCSANKPNKFGNSAIHSACIAGNSNIVRVLVTSPHCDPNKVNGSGCTPLHLSFQKRDINTMECLLSSGRVNPSIPDNSGNTILHYACLNNDFDLVNFLLSHGCCNAIVNQQNLDGYSCCHYACIAGACEVIEILLRSNLCDLNLISQEGRTPIHVALKCDKTEAVTVLALCSQCDLDITDEFDCTPLRLAYASKDKESMKVLLESGRAHPDIQDMDGNTVLHQACADGDFSIVELLTSYSNCTLDIRNYKGRTPLIETYFSNRMAARSLIEQKLVTPNGTDFNGHTLLQHACWRDDIDMVSVILTGRHVSNERWRVHVLPSQTRKWTYPSRSTVPIVCAVDTPDLEEMKPTPLHIAWTEGKMKLVQILIPYQRSVPKQVDGYGNNLLNKACIEGWTELVRILITTPCCDSNTPNNVGDTPLHSACRNNDSVLVGHLASCTYCNPNILDANGYTPLHLTFNSGDIVSMQQLLESGRVDPNIPDNYGNTVFHRACMKGDMQAFHLLLRSNLCKIDLLSLEGNAPIHVALLHNQTDVVTALALHSTCDLNILNASRYTPLRLAYERKDEKSMMVLLKCRRTDPNIPDTEGNTVLHRACIEGDLPVVELLTSYCNCLLNEQNNEGKTPLIAGYYSDRMTARFLIEHQFIPPNGTDVNGDTLLQHACCRDDTDMVSLILKGHHVVWSASVAPLVCAIETPNLDKMKPTPLHIAWARGNLPLTKLLIPYQWSIPEEFDEDGNNLLNKACIEGWTELVRILVTNPSCNPKEANKNGSTPLHSACIKKNDVLVKLVLSCSSCDPNIRDANGYAPLHLAFDSGDIVSMQQLLKSGRVDPDITDKDGNTVFHRACMKGDLQALKVLVTQSDCSRDSLNKKNETPLIAAYFSHHEVKSVILLIKKRYVDPNHVDSKGCSILYYACKRGDTDMVEFLLSNHFCDPNSLNKIGRNCCHVACIEGNLDVVKLLVGSEQCQLNLTTSKGNTALHLACMNEHSTIVKVLVENGFCCYSPTSNKNHPSPNGLCCVRNSEGDTPLHVTCREKHVKIAKLLLRSCSSSIRERNNDGKTPIQLTDHHKIVRKLIGHGANPQDLYEYFRKQLDECKSKYPIEPYIKVFICGNPGNGKTTLALALHTFTDNDGVLHRLRRQVTPQKLRSTEDDPQTAGIEVTKFRTKAGKILLYDFAGQKEYYGSHEAVLDITKSSSALVFLVLLNLENSNAELEKQLSYWIAFISNHCNCSPARPRIIVVGSHLDRLKGDPHSKKAHLKDIAKREADNSETVEYVDVVLLNCTQESAALDYLHGRLKDHRSTWKDTVEDIRCCILLSLLEKLYSKMQAVTLLQIISGVKENFNDFPLPYVPQELLTLLSILSDRGYLILLENTDRIEDSWIIQDQTFLLQCVNGKIFAPQKCEFSLRKQASNTGVVSLAEIKDKFGPKTDMIIQLLIILEFCRKIKDEIVLSHLPFKGDEFYIFPALVKETRSDIVPEPEEGAYQSCWYLRCIEHGKFFSPRFLQVLLLRLVFAVVPEIVESPASEKGLDTSMSRPKCVYKVWTNGLSWSDKNGNFALVELIEQSTAVIVWTKCLKGNSKIECVKLRSTVIRHVLKAKEDFCGGIDDVKECFLDMRETLQYPLTKYLSELTAFSVQDIARSVSEGDKCVQGHVGSVSEGDKCAQTMVQGHVHCQRPNYQGITELISTILYFEPYHVVVDEELMSQWKEVLETIFKPENMNKPVSSAFVSDLAKFTADDEPVRSNVFWYGKVKQVVTIDEDTYESLNWKLGQYSIFCGRKLNPLDLKEPLPDPPRMKPKPTRTPSGEEKPQLQELLKFAAKEGNVNIPQLISTKFKMFGIFLLDDADGSKVEALNYKHRGDPDAINIAILQEWLQGKGRKPVSWQTLVDVLADCQLKLLAGNISDVKLQCAQ